MLKESTLEELTFETALAELQALVAKLETGDLPLDESLALFERGQQLSQRCNALLDQAELKVQQLLPAADGADELVDFEHD